MGTAHPLRHRVAMMNLHAFGPPGFQHAPVSKLLLAVVVAATFGAVFGGVTHWLDFRLHTIVGQIQLWRLLTCALVFETVGELVVGTVLLYNFRLFERQWGSPKFCCFLLITHLLALLVEFSVSGLFHLTSTLPGPYSIIFAFFVPYCWHIPRQQTYSLFNNRIRFSGKTFLYILGLQLSMCSVPSSIVSTVVGLLAGALYFSHLAPFDRCRVPVCLSHCCKVTVGRLLGVNPHEDAEEQQQQQQQEEDDDDDDDDGLVPAGQPNRRYMRLPPREDPVPRLAGQPPPPPSSLLSSSGGAAAASLASWPAPPQPGHQVTSRLESWSMGGAAGQQQQQAPSEDNVEVLEEMGFDREVAIRVLTECNDSLEQATNVLLTSGVGSSTPP
mgnify:CR=1 FL=1